jgi:hypothetical protein
MKQATELMLETSEQFMIAESGFSDDSSAAHIEYDQQQVGYEAAYVQCVSFEELQF